MMTTKYIMDASAWIEYFLGTKKGKVVKKILEQKNSVILTPDTTVGEVFWWSLREDKVFGPMLKCMRAHGSFVELNTNIWIEATNLKKQMRDEGRKGAGILDAVLVDVQRLSGGTIVTSDSHFKGMKNVVML